MGSIAGDRTRIPDRGSNAQEGATTPVSGAGLLDSDVSALPSSGHGRDRAAVRAGTVDAPGLDRGVHGHRGRPRDRWCRRPAGDVRAAAHVEFVAARRGDRRRIHDRGVQPGDTLPAVGHRRHRRARGPRIPRDPHVAPGAVASLALRCVRRARGRRAADPARWTRLPAAGAAAAGDRVLHRDPRRVRVRDQCVGGAEVRGSGRCDTHVRNVDGRTAPARAPARDRPTRHRAGGDHDRSRLGGQIRADGLGDLGIDGRSSGSVGSRLPPSPGTPRSHSCRTSPRSCDGLADFGQGYFRSIVAPSSASCRSSKRRSASSCTNVNARRYASRASSVRSSRRSSSPRVACR